MSSFEARLRLPGHSRLPLGVEVDIDHERMTVTAGNRKVAAWPLAELEVDTRSDGFHIIVDGEEMVLNVTDSVRFAAELGAAGTARHTPSFGSYRPARTEVSPVNGDPDGAPKGDGAIVSQWPGGGAASELGQHEDLQRRISEVAETLSSDAMSPAQAFGEWVRLLKELNRRHGQGSMPSDQYFRLNTQVLDLIPEPKAKSPGQET